MGLFEWKAKGVMDDGQNKPRSSVRVLDGSHKRLAAQEPEQDPLAESGTRAKARAPPFGANCTTIRKNMKTDAQRRAESVYRKKSVKQLTIRFYPNDDDEAMYAWLKSKENVTEYLKALVAADMEKPS